MTIDYIKQFVIDNKDNYGIQLKRHHSQLFNEINSAYNFDTFGQKLYHFINGNDIGKCEICGNQCKFDGIHKGYRKRCSYKCLAENRHRISNEIRNCIICNAKFEIYKKREKTTCSNECLLLLNSTPEVNKKRMASLKSTMVKKYGVDHPSKIDGFWDKVKKTKLERYGAENYVNIEKCKQTKLDRYGDENYFNVGKARDTKQQKYGDANYNNRPKFRKTNLEKYGVEYPIQLESMKESRRETSRKKYGVDYPTQSDSVKSQTILTVNKKYDVPHVMKNNIIKNKSIENGRKYYYSQIIASPKLLEYVIPMFSEDEFINTFRDNRYKFQCKTCGSIFIDNIDGGHIPRCWECYPYVKSKSEEQIVQYINSLDSTITILRNKRSILPSGCELDIYLPNKNIAIEFNGLFWHSESGGGKDKRYHLNKTTECENMGIRLIHIFEDEWINKPEIVKSKLKHILGMSENEKIYARNCQIKEITSKDALNFIEKNHIQGGDTSTIKLGAYYKENLVAVMTFGRRRISTRCTAPVIGEYELYRFATNNHIVVGIGGKLLSYFIRTYSPSKIISYADRRYSTDNSFYSKIGFNLVSITVPNYWYIKFGENVRHHRFGFRKSILPKRLLTFDPNLTEWQNMQLNGWDRIWDCGNLKYEWKSEIQL